VELDSPAVFDPAAPVVPETNRNGVDSVSIRGVFAVEPNRRAVGSTRLADADAHSR
jgi:hypothetical protein